MQKVKTAWILLFTGIFLLLFSLIFCWLNTSTLEDVADDASAQILQKYKVAATALQKLQASDLNEEGADFYKLFREKNIGLYGFERDSLVYWNNAQIPLGKHMLPLNDTAGLIRLRQGYYLYLKLEKDEKTSIALCLIKPLYDLQNNYLRNTFSAWTGIPAQVELETSTKTNVVDLSGKKLFSLRGDEAQYTSEFVANSGLSIFAGGLLLIMLSLLLFIRHAAGRFRAIWLLVLIPLLRALMIIFKWPAFFYKSVLFDLAIFGNAQSDINFYLGDILLNAIALFFVAVALHLLIGPGIKRYRKNLLLALLTALSVFVVFEFNTAVKSLVTNSTLNFDFLSIFTIKFPAFMAVLGLAIYALTLYTLLDKIIALFGKSFRHFSLFSALVLMVCVLQSLLLPGGTLLELCWYAPFAMAMFLLSAFDYLRFSLGLGLQILVMSVITSVLLNFYIDKDQQQNLSQLALELSERHDVILENEFAGIPAKIESDSKLAVLLQFLPNGKKEIEQLLKQKYFSEYFNRYNVDFSLFDANCNPLLSPKDPVLMNEGFFDDRIRVDADSTSVPALFFVKNFRNNSVYIGKVRIQDKLLYVFLEPKQFEEMGSFPDLLLDKSQQKQDVFKNFSYAIYSAGQNTNRYGDFNYPFFILDSASLAKSNPAYNHYYFKNDQYTQVISQKRKTFADQFTYNSYVFLFFSVISYFCYFIYTLVFTAHLKNPSLTRRIQTVVILLLLLVMSAVGIISGNLVSGQFESDNKEQLQEKTEIIISELSGQFKPEEFFDESQKEVVNLKLNEYAHLFNTVISIFDKNGYLFNTSQPRLYDLGLAAGLANPKAFGNLKANRSSVESVTETAGNLNYFSLYTPLYDSKQQLIGFVNLPYFAKKSDLVNELSGIISALINVYVILFVISILAGLILSGYITKPLRLIKQQISNISLGQQNEKILWESNDEIGRLVAEYNQMLLKLENSASLLARSERESAWREMAKQVAHEIKNPLTPMKLNLQYLQHLMKNNPDDFKEKFGKTSAGIIEQIDSLANIANEFSNFAKLPAAQLQAVNLVEVINSVVLIFEHQRSSVISNTIAEQEIWIKGDKDQCLRVFNNILKNAMQALDGIERPRIEIGLELVAEKVTVSIKDNGCGIADDLKSRIFSPNFTTKTTGSGLGLAMVKNIMQGFGGSIRFESETDTGTVFYLEFKRVSGE